MEKFSIQIDTAALAERLKTLRKQAGLTQGGLAKHLGLKDASSVTNFEKGTIPTIPVLVKMCEIFGKSLMEILYGTDERPLLPGTGNEPALALYREFVSLERVDQKLLMVEIRLLSDDNRQARDDLRRSVGLVLKAYGYA